MIRRQILWWMTVFGILVVVWGGLLLSSQPLSYARGAASVTPTLIVTDRQFLPGVLGAIQGPTATATTPPPTMTPFATPTMTPTGTPPVDKGTLTPDLVKREMLGTTAVHQFTLALPDDDLVTLQAVALPLANLTLTVAPENGDPVAEVTSSSPGAVVRIADLALEAGVYQVRVSSDSTAVTDYILLFTDIDSPPTNVAGALRTNGTSSGLVTAGTDDLWFFSGESGSRISLSIVGAPDTDPYAELYDPANARLLIIDDGGVDEPEELSDFTLPADGTFMLQIGEFEFNAMAYQVMFQK